MAETAEQWSLLNPFNIRLAPVSNTCACAPVEYDEAAMLQLGYPSIATFSTLSPYTDVSGEAPPCPQHTPQDTPQVALAHHLEEQAAAPPSP